MAKLGSLMRALLVIARNGTNETGLAGRICRAYVEGLDIDGAGISLLTATASRETVCASDATVAHVEDLQYTLGEGPCIEAAVTGHPVLIPDIREYEKGSRWPVFAAAVVEQAEVAALFALPLQLGAINIGVLDLYRTASGPLEAVELHEALRAADTAALMLLGLGVDSADGQQWDHSWSSRAEVHQATGMIIAQLGIEAQAAFARLRGYAFSHERTLADVARDVVTRRLQFTDEMN